MSTKQRQDGSYLIRESKTKKGTRRKSHRDEGRAYKPADGETRKQRRATAASGSGSGSGSGEQRQARAAGGLAGGASSGRRKQREERAATSSGRREQRRAAGGASGDRGSVCEQRQRRAATTAAFASSDSGEQRDRDRKRRQQRALARSAQRLGSGERPGGACLKRAAWEISEALGPRLASPERLGERPSAFCNHCIKLNNIFCSFNIQIQLVAA
ncbi:hypothetical protein C4D60_Mb09t07920 [Musa balbisiana]|uniref:Uncharacterized protein n=1 Tax=Musa balbisiana TaxID=52838 RepID=A0A4V4H333_MUSBA|nr:hypothetical protein C4D60_Mb09t07920 [Musa balbisiana]